MKIRFEFPPILIYIFLILLLTKVSSAELDVGFEASSEPVVEIVPADVPINYSVVNVNNSIFFQGYTPTTLMTWMQTTFDTLYQAIGSYLTSSEANETYVNEDEINNSYLTLSNYSIDTNATTECGDGEYLDGSGNCYNTNDTIDAKLIITYYNATQSAFIVGTLDGGTLSDIGHTDGVYDEVTFNFTEASGSPGLDLRINFTGISDFNAGVMRYKTSSLKGDYPIIQLWNYDKSVWEDYPPVGESLVFATITQPVFDTTNHIQSNIVQMRIYKSSNGNTNNYYYVDWIAISKGYGTPSGEEIDPYSIHITDLPLENKTLSHCSNVTGTASDLCTLVDTDTITTLENVVFENKSLLNDTYQKLDDINKSYALNITFDNYDTFNYNMSLDYDTFNYNMSIDYDAFNYNMSRDLYFYNQSTGTFNMYNSIWSADTNKTFNETYDIINSSRWSLVGSDISYSGGQVGIGTATPFNDLHVKATTDAYQFKIQADSSSAENWAGLGFTVTGSDSLQPYAGIRAIRKTGFSDVDLSFRAGNDGEVMYLDGSTGNVGIGTTSPSAKLHLSGGDTSITYTKATIALGYSTTGQYPNFIHTRHNSGTSVNNAIDFYTSDGTSAGVFPTNAVHGLTINNGNVGIGTTSPDYPLHVVGNTSDANGTISIYADKNISATGYITRTSVFDKSKSVWDYIKDADSYLTDEKIDHKKFYGYAGEFEVTDLSRPEQEEYDEEECSKELQEKTCEEEQFNEIKNKTELIEVDCSEYIEVCEDITKTRTTYPYIKIEEGVSLNEEVDLLRQAVYELKLENDLIKLELCKKDNTYSWCK